MSKQIRYIRDWGSGCPNDTNTYWVQIAAWDASRVNSTLTDASSNRAYNKASTGSGSGSNNRTAAQVVDGDINTSRYFYGPAPAWVQIDMGALYTIEFIQIWHYYGDSRIFFGHKLEVSANGSTWVVIVPGNGSAVESASGNFYYLFSSSTADWEKSAFISTLQNAIQAARLLRGVSAPSFSVPKSTGDLITSTKISELRNAMTNWTLAWSELTTDNLGKIEGKDYDEVLINYSRILNNAACTADCIQQCAGGCATVCGANCQNGCGSSGCQSNCVSGCTDACHGGCFAACQKGCGGTCSNSGCSNTCGVNTCANNCVGTYSGGNCNVYCSSTCGSTCGSGCGSSCGSGNCVTTCGGGCGSACAGGCSIACQKDCGAACQGGCATTCNLSCGAVCSHSCGASCNVLCNATCANGCENTCVGTVMSNIATLT